ncbi:MAG: hypothetical protein GY896_04425 [Gammaproteobacteria bacterium]|nr:hypothetical protein [Gammaproteobacteria bacterium]
MNRTFIAEVIVILALLLLPMAQAQDKTQTASAEATSESSESVHAQRAQTIRKLLTIKQALEDKRSQVRQLLEQLDAADDDEKAKIRGKVANHREIITALTRSFENIAVSGANRRALTDAEENELSWRDELVQIARPILDSLKDATEKPRRIEELRREIKLFEQQLEVVRKATESISLFNQYEMPPLVEDGLAEVAVSWREHSSDIERSLEISRDELRHLEADDIKLLETMGRVVREFSLGRGLTLLIGLIAAIAVWFAMRALRRLVNSWRRPSQNADHAAKIRLLLYGYHLLTIVLISVAVLSVFYVRGDLLLLSLAIVALVMLALSAWRYLPGYIMEARLLINVGAAREGERVTYNGLPFRIASLNLFSYLRNPELEGVIRLPLSALAQLTSRPAANDVWFPCSSGDYLLLPDGSFAEVLQQTIEQIRLKVLGSVVQFATVDFLQLNVRNLSRNGFNVIVVFGLDYQHQEISLDRVPKRLESGLEEAFKETGFGDGLNNLLVEFKAAGTNSLDYLICATMDGRYASSYFAIARLIQQTCVDICNHEDWVIPFAQLTLHQAEASYADDVRAALAKTT